jgi:transaldolase
MTVELFLDTPDIEAYKMHKNLISGGTTNPSLMSKMGIPEEKYESHCQDILKVLERKVLSIEVTSIIPEKMVEDAQKFHEWDKNRIVVKIPAPFYLDERTAERCSPGIMQNPPSSVKVTDGPEGKRAYIDTLPVMAELASKGVALNITCCFGYEQARDIAATIKQAALPTVRESYFSIFWGRLLDQYVEQGIANKTFTDYADLSKIIDLSAQEVNETARQLEGSKLRIILGSVRLPKKWESAAAEDANEALKMKKLAYRAVLKVAQPVNAIPTVSPALLEASRYHAGTSNAVTGFLEDYLKLKEAKN